MCLIGRDRSDDPPFRKTTVVYEKEPVHARTAYTTTGHPRSSYVSDRGRSSYVSDHHSHHHHHHGGRSSSRKSSRRRSSVVYLERDPARVSYTSRTSQPAIVVADSGRSSNGYVVRDVRETRRTSNPVVVKETRRYAF